MKRTFVMLALFCAYGCSGDTVQPQRSALRGSGGITLSEVKHSETMSTLHWSAPTTFEAITLSARADNAATVKMVSLPRKFIATISCYTSEGGKLLCSDKSEPAVLSPGQSHTFEKDFEVSRDVAAKISFYEVSIVPAK